MADAVPLSAEELQAERACFDGMLLAALAYGALIMIYMQLIQVMLSRPQRNQTFWKITVYSTAIFPLATLSIASLLKSSERAYIDGRDLPGGASTYHKAHASDVVNVIGVASGTVLPWFGDILMFCRLMLVWNFQWWILTIPALTYLSKTAMSIPVLISQIRPNDTMWASKAPAFETCYYSLSVAFNISASLLVSVRLCMMRKKIEIVMGKLHASFYTSPLTILVESGGFFTIWATVYLVARTRHSFTKEVFLLPYAHILAITRMLIILRMAQDRSWSRDLVTASDRGVLEWQVSSTHSIPLHDISPNSISMTSFNKKILPRKFQDEAAVM